MSASLSPATGGDEPTGRGPWSLGMPRFPGPVESRFRRAFAAAGASTRAEIHVLVLVILAVGFLTKLATGHPTTVGIAFGVAAATHVVALLWGRHPASLRVSPSASAATFVGTQFITLICVLVVHYDGGATTHGSLPHIVLFAVLMSVIFAHLTFGALVTVIGAFIGVLVLGEWLVLGAVATRLSDGVLSAVIVVGGLVAAREIELIARTSWVQRGRIATLHETDALTGIANRIPLVNELIAAGDSREPLSLLLLDIGGFKTFNDQHGHLAGDEVLRSVAGALRDTADGPNTLVARIAGKRFAVLWRGEQIDEAAA
ncbi:MAG: diguanylate cyclase, partial [Gordonia amarae]